MQEPHETPLSDASVLSASSKSMEQRYRREVWWVSHRHGLARLFVAFLFVLEGAAMLAGVWAFVDYYVLNYVDEQGFVSGFLDGQDVLHAAAQQQRPEPLAIDEPRAVAGKDAYDIVAFVENKNPAHVAELTYHFTFSGGQTDPETVVLIQGAKRPLVAFGVEGGRPTDAQVSVDQLEWRRVDGHVISDPMDWARERLNFVYRDLRQDNDVVLGSSVLGRTSMTLVNQSGFGYDQLEVYVVLRRGGTILGVNRTQVSALLPREERFVQINWFDGSLSPQTIEMYPVVNIYDDTVYLPTDGIDERDRRDPVIR